MSDHEDSPYCKRVKSATNGYESSDCYNGGSSTFEPPIDKQASHAFEQRQPTVNFVTSTLNVKDFCNCILGFSCTSAEHVLFRFGPDGLTMYAREIAIVVFAYWNRTRFQSYDCGDEKRVWVHTSRLVELRKRIKDVETLTIAIVEEDDIRLQFSGELKFSVGGAGPFTFNAFGAVETQEPVTLNHVYLWHATTAAQRFQTNIDFICDDNDAVQFKISGDTIRLAGVTDAGRFGETASQTIETRQAVDFECLFYKKLLKIVTMLHNIHPSLTVSFSTGDEGEELPVLFSSSFDQGTSGVNNKSHFSVFIAPLRKPDE